MNTVLMIGCGDIGQRVAQLCLAKGLAVQGLARRDESAVRLQQAGIRALRGDLDQPDSLCDLPTRGATVFYFAPPPTTGEDDPLLMNFLASMGPGSLPERLVLISTTAVYGDCQGAWITEEHPAQPETARGRRRLDAERNLRRWATEQDVAFVILRVGGIYGPGRLPLARLEKGLPILAPEDSPFTNRIHQDDLAQVCMAAADRGVSGEIYNVADGQPGTMSQYFMDIAQAFGLPQPPIVSRAEAEQVMSAGMLSYLKESRRLDNRKLREQLKVDLQYPDLAAGLAAMK